jgi:hypothetical protein
MRHLGRGAWVVLLAGFVGGPALAQGLLQHAGVVQAVVRPMAPSGIFATFVRVDVADGEGLAGVQGVRRLYMPYLDEGQPLPEVGKQCTFAYVIRSKAGMDFLHEHRESYAYEVKRFAC